MSDFQNTPAPQQAPQQPQDANAADYTQQQNNPYNQQQSDPYAQQQQYYVYPPQGYYYPQPAYQRWNTLCIIGFILSFLVAPAGLICSIIAVIQINKTGEKSKGMAVAGIIVSVFNLLIGLLLVVLFAIGVSVMVDSNDIRQYSTDGYSQFSDPGNNIDKLLEEHDLT